MSKWFARSKLDNQTGRESCQEKLPEEETWSRSQLQRVVIRERAVRGVRASYKVHPNIHKLWALIVHVKKKGWKG